MSSAGSHNSRLLVVDDDPAFGSLVEQAVSSLTDKVSVDVAFTPAAAIALTSNSEYALLVLDLIFPDGNGLDVLRHLHEAEKPTPVLVVSRYIPDSLEKALQAFPAVRAVIAKPVDPSIIATVAVKLAMREPSPGQR